MKLLILIYFLDANCCKNGDKKRCCAVTTHWAVKMQRTITITCLPNKLCNLL